MRAQNMMKQTYLFLLLCLFSFNVVFSNLEQELTIDQALKIAYNNRSLLYAREYAIEKQKKNELIQLSGYLPKLGLEQIVNRNVENLLPKNQTIIEIKQLLLSFSGPIDLYKIAQQETEIAYWQKELSYDNIQFEVERNFLQLWNVDHQRESIQALDYFSYHRFEKAKLQDDVGFFSNNDFYIQLARFDERQARVKSYVDEMHLAYDQFARALEMPIETPLNQFHTAEFITEAIALGRVPLKWYLKQSMNNRKELFILHHQIERSRKLRNFHTKFYLPTASFFADITNGRIASLLEGDGQHTFWEFGLTFEWEFDGLENAHQAEFFHKEMLENIEQKVNTMNIISLEVETAYHELQILTKELAAARTAFKQQEIAFHLRKTEFEVGQLSLIEFDRAQSRWQDAQFEIGDIETQTAIKQRELMLRCGYPEIDIQTRMESYEV